MYIYIYVHISNHIMTSYDLLCVCGLSATRLEKPLLAVALLPTHVVLYYAIL